MKNLSLFSAVLLSGFFVSVAHAWDSEVIRTGQVTEAHVVYPGNSESDQLVRVKINVQARVQEGGQTKMISATDNTLLGRINSQDRRGQGGFALYAGGHNLFARLIFAGWCDDGNRMVNGPIKVAKIGEIDDNGKIDFIDGLSFSSGSYRKTHSFLYNRNNLFDRVLLGGIFQMGTQDSYYDSVWIDGLTQHVGSQESCDSDDTQYFAAGRELQRFNLPEHFKRNY